MFRIIALIVLAVFLLISTIDYIVGNSSPWVADLGTAFLVVGILLLILSRRRKTITVYLPGGEGLLTIEGENYPFIYMVGTTKEGLGFQGETEGPHYAVRFTAHIAQKGRIEADEEAIRKLSQDASIPAVVTFATHRVSMKLRKEPARCGCDSDIPCWRGERYIGVYYQRPEMLIQVVCIVIHWRRKEPVPAEKHRKEKRFPALLPSPVPAPATATIVSQ